jgi:hypothetical protein
MKKNPSLLLSFLQYTEAELLVKAHLIIEKMTGNTALANPVPALADVQAATTAYSNALTEARKLGIDNVAIKNDKRALLEQVLQQLGRWVIFMADSNITVLLSSGFDVTKAPEPIQLEDPGNPMLENGLGSGTIICRVKRVKGAVSFSHEYTDTLPAPNVVWQSCVSSRSRYEFSNLVPGRQYWFRVQVSGCNNQQVCTPVASKYVQ